MSKRRLYDKLAGRRKARKKAGIVKSRYAKRWLVVLPGSLNSKPFSDWEDAIHYATTTKDKN